jgi:16S rRNA (guanine527-N7)-methyltransferase
MLEALAEEADPHTTVSDPHAALEVHVADSLSGLVVEELALAGRIADLGAGSGFPGLVLAIANPRAQVDLVESAGRRSAVATRLARAADIANARMVTARAEDWGRLPPSLGGGRELYEAVTARALGPLALLAEYASPLLRAEGVLVAWKGARDADEERAGAAAAARAGLEPVQVLPVQPYPSSRSRHLHVLRKTGRTPEGIPRRAGMARKRPLG